MSKDILNDAKSVLYEGMLYAIEGESPEKAIDNYIDKNMKTAVVNCMIPIRVNIVPKEYRPDPSKFMDTPFEERAKLVKENKRKYTMEQYAKMGIVVLEEEDDYLCRVQLPDGWKIERIDSLWCNILDDKGRKRINFFYKAAFWGRDAFTNFLCRYGISILPFDEYMSDATYEDRILKPWSVYLTDCGEKVEKIHEITPTTKKEFYDVEDKLRFIGLEYLNEHYPDHKDINAYWD